jgi:hypothetical protein
VAVTFDIRMQTCPICHRSVEPSERHPQYVCGDCASQARSQNGRPLRFENESLSGGYRVFHADTGEPYPSHECYIHGIKCQADEHRLGGIVIQRDS